MLTALILTHALMSAPAQEPDPFAQYKVDLVPIGTKVPNFKVKDDMGKAFDLYKTFENGKIKAAFINYTFENKKTKATIINFWFDTWGGCRAEFPHLEELYKELKSKGLNVIGVNWNDTMEDVQAFRKEFELTMPLILGGSGDDAISAVYGVKGFPTNYVLDKDGNVVAQIIGGDMEAIRAALAELGVK